MKIIKFGGSTFKNENDIVRTIEFIKDLYTNNTDIVIIISAFDKFTSTLNEIVNNIITKPTQFNYEFNKIKLFIEKFIDINSNQLIIKRLEEIEEILFAISILEECSKKVLDSLISIGDLISSEIFYLKLMEVGTYCHLINARDVFVTDENYGNAGILFDMTLTSIKGNIKGNINIIAGFIGSSENGNHTTLGMENSNLSAILCSIALNTKECEYFTDTKGIFEIDPKISNSENIENINYEDALILSKMGLKQFTIEQITLAKEYNIELIYCNLEFSNMKTHINNLRSSFKNILIIKNNSIEILSKNIKEFLATISSFDIKEISKIEIIFTNSIIKIYLETNSNDFINKLYLKLNQNYYA